MPELAEVEYFRKQWDKGQNEPILEVLLHPTARTFEYLDAANLKHFLVGSRIIHSTTHGKQLFFYFKPTQTLGIQLGMTGRLSIQDARYAQGKHDHFILRQKNRSLVFTDCRMFGRVKFEQTNQPEWTKNLPVEVLSVDFDKSHLENILKRHPRTPLKVLLLNQGAFPGIGNWMADEILWQAKIEPSRLSELLSTTEKQQLYRSLRDICRTALRTIGRDLDHPPAGWLFFARWRDGNPCPRCGNLLSRKDLQGRTACWCSVCQSNRGAAAENRPAVNEPRSSSRWAKSLEEAAIAFKTEVGVLKEWLKIEGNPGYSKDGRLDLEAWRAWVRFTGRSWFRKRTGTHDKGVSERRISRTRAGHVTRGKKVPLRPVP